MSYKSDKEIKNELGKGLLRQEHVAALSLLEQYIGTIGERVPPEVKAHLREHLHSVRCVREVLSEQLKIVDKVKRGCELLRNKLYPYCMDEARLREVGLRSTDEVDYRTRRAFMMEHQADKPDV